MTTLQATEAQNTEGFWNFGDYQHKDDETFLQDAARAAVLAKYTVVARKASDLKLIPLTDLSPALLSAYLTCGVIGSTAAEFAAISDAYFKMGVDGQAVEEFGPFDFTGLDTVLDTPGSYLCGTNGAIIAAGWDAIADGAGTFPIDGINVVLAAMDFTDCLTFWDVQETINHHAAGRFTVTYDGDANVFQIISPTSGELSTVAALSAGAAGTDITAAGYLNGTVAGAATAGTGGEGLFESIVDILNAGSGGKYTAAFNGDEFIFFSNSKGLPKSAITVLTAGVSGTDISGTGGNLFLNGLTVTGVVTSATGEASSAIPIGIFIGDAIAIADLVAGDVTDQYVAISGDPAGFDVDKLILENSLDIDDIVQSTGQSIRQHLTNIGLIASATSEIFQTDPLT